MKLPVPILTTERLTLRPLRHSDAPDLFEAFSDEEACKYWSHAAHKTVEQSQARVDEVIAKNDLQTWVITQSKDGPALGWVVLVPGHREGVAELGYIICRSAWGKGFMAEAANAVVDYGFGIEKYRRIFADMDPENIGSTRIAEKCGMTYEGRLKGNWDTQIGVRDSLIYGRVELPD